MAHIFAVDQVDHGEESEHIEEEGNLEEILGDGAIELGGKAEEEDDHSCNEDSAKALTPEHEGGTGGVETPS